MKAAKVVDPAAQSTRDQVRFGATVELADEDDNRRTLTIVGDDETDASAGRIGWSAPLARALIGAQVGDERIVRLPAGEKSYEVVAISYPRRTRRRDSTTSCGGSAGIAFAQASAIAVSAATAACSLVVAVDRPPRRPARVGIGTQVVERR